MWWEFKWPLWKCTQNLCPNDWGHKLKQDSPLLPIQGFTNGLIMGGGVDMEFLIILYSSWQPLINYCPVLHSHIRWAALTLSLQWSHSYRTPSWGILQDDLLKILGFQYKFAVKVFVFFLDDYNGDLKTFKRWGNGVFIIMVIYGYYGHFNLWSHCRQHNTAFCFQKHYHCNRLKNVNTY